jgi:NAD(P)-dependent dehydrogenase (short-subunit alcohol dehydrogenase family)
MLEAKKVWFITGANRGLGRAFVEAALERGDQVAATSRSPESLKDLSHKYSSLVLPLKLDITDRKAVQQAIQQAKHQFGRIDVLVNNAGFGTFGAVEELSEKQLRTQFEVNVFGTFHVTQAVLPIMREQGSGHILQISSVSGVVTFPYQGAYASSKWAVEGLTEVLAQEVRGFGIKVTLVEPGPFLTDLHGDSSSNAEPQPQYEGLRKWMEQMENTMAKISGNPCAAGEAILKIVNAPEPPLRVFLGKSGLAFVPRAYEERIKMWKEWEHLSATEGLGEVFPSH